MNYLSRSLRDAIRGAYSIEEFERTGIRTLQSNLAHARRGNIFTFGDEGLSFLYFILGKGRGGRNMRRRGERGGREYIKSSSQMRETKRLRAENSCFSILEYSTSHGASI